MDKSKPSSDDFGSKEFVFEKEQKMEEIMEARHQNSLVGLRIERLLDEEVGFTDVVSARAGLVEIGNRAKAVLSEADSRIPTKKYIKFNEAIGNFLTRKIVSCRFEHALIEQFVDKGREFSPENLGNELFALRTSGREKKGSVTAERNGPYFIIACSDEEDYAQFLAGSKEVDSHASLSGATYHRALEFE